jgi:transcriptional regulator with XRE-family HTH domain
MRNVRILKNITQDALGEMVGISRAHVGSLETCRRRLTFALGVKMATALNMPVQKVIDYFYEEAVREAKIS